MEPLPGLIHWHAPLTVLTPGLLCLLIAPALLPLRGRQWFAWSIAIAAALVALLVAIALLRAAWRMDAGWSTIPGGWVQGGVIPLLCALGAAGFMAWKGRGAGPGQALWQSATAYLMVLWALPLWILALLPAERDRARRGVLILAMLLGALAATALNPAIGHLLAAATVLTLNRQWRVAALLASCVAFMSLWLGGHGG